MAMPSHEPTPEKRQQVETLAAFGIPQTSICRMIGISDETLRKYYPDELEMGADKAVAQVAGFLFAACKRGSVDAIKFYLKTRGRWRERHEIDFVTPLKHEGTVQATVVHVTADQLAGMSEDELARLYRGIVAEGAVPDGLFGRGADGAQDVAGAPAAKANGHHGPAGSDPDRA